MEKNIYMKNFFSRKHNKVKKQEIEFFGPKFQEFWRILSRACVFFASLKLEICSES
jgi:hypothetical protein